LNTYIFWNGLTLDGFLDVSLGAGFSPNPGDAFDILDWYESLSGSFFSLNLPAGDWDTSSLLTTGVISYLGETPNVPVPEPSTMLLLGSGLIGLAGYGRKKIFK